MTYTIYLRTNTANGKCYVGQTSDFKYREYQWHCLKMHYANEHICNDREKYGLDNFTVEVLAETDNREDAWELEQKYIKELNTLWPNGYNISKGGGGANGLKHSDESKQKMSESKKGKPSPMKGKHLSNEAKQKISEALKGEKHPMYGKPSPMKGKHHTDETKQKMSESMKGKLVNNRRISKQVYQYTLDGTLVKIWPSVAECGRNGFNKGNISMCCNGKLKTAGGYIWSF